jgi:hypothetical protein
VHTEIDEAHGGNPPQPDWQSLRVVGIDFPVSLPSYLRVAVSEFTGTQDFPQSVTDPPDEELVRFHEDGSRIYAGVSKIWVYTDPLNVWGTRDTYAPAPAVQLFE